MRILFAILKLMLRLPTGTIIYRFGINILTKPVTIGGGKAVMKVKVFLLFHLGEWACSVQTAGEEN